MLTLADLHEWAGRLAAGSWHTFTSGDRSYDPSQPSPLRNIPRVSARIHELEGVEAEDARDHLASLSPERRAELEAEWDQCSGGTGR